MTIFKKTLLAAAVALGASSAFAYPTFAPGVNDIQFQSLENQYRTLANCGIFGGCLAADAANDPSALYRRANPAIIGNLQVGDIFAGVVHVTGTTPIPNDFFSKEFTGYFAQEVSSVDFTGGISAVVINFKTATIDPFGKLAAGEMFRFYTDTSPDFLESGGVTTFVDIARATNGGPGTSFWGSLGLGTEGYA